MNLLKNLNLTQNDKKKITYLLVLAAAAVIVLIILEGFDKEEELIPKTTPTPTSAITDDTAAELAGVLSQIKGVGRVSCALEYDGAGVKEYGYNQEESSRTSGKEGDLTTEKTTHKEMVLLNGEETPVVISEESPKIKGVLVVAEGAHNPAIKEKILNAVSTFLDLGANRVEICPMEV
ncbi:MAG: hypothetical protein RSB05_05455 [Clostridiales bacterium]